MAQPQQPGSRFDIATEPAPVTPVRHTRANEGRPDFQEALSVIRLRKWSILSITLLVMGIALWVSSQQVPIYESEAAVLVRPLDFGGTEPIEPNIATEIELAGSVAVAEIVVDNLKLEGDPRDLLGNLSVEAPEETEILEMNYSHSDPEFARTMAQGFAVGYLDYRRQTVTEELLKAAEAAENELQILRDRLNRLEQDLRQLEDFDPRRGTLESEAELLQGLILQRQLSQLTLPKQVAVGTVVQSAAVPGTPVSPNHATNVTFGFIAGLGLAIGLAFLRDRLSGRLRTDFELETQLGAPALGSVPPIRAWRRRKQPYLITRQQWRSPESEAYRMLRTSVLSSASLHEAKMILVSSPHLGEGKTATVGNLAVVLARAGMKVCVVSADLRRPRIHEFFATKPVPGLVDVLQGRATLDQVLTEITSPVIPGPEEGTSSITFLPSGPVPDGPAELLASPAMDRILKEVKASADVVLIDAPPVLPVTDALVLAEKVDSVVLVVGPRSATRGSIVAARQQLDKVGAHLLGAVLNGWEGSAIQRNYFTY